MCGAHKGERWQRGSRGGGKLNTKHKPSYCISLMRNMGKNRNGKHTAEQVIMSLELTSKASGEIKEKKNLNKMHERNGETTHTRTHTHTLGRMHISYISMRWHLRAKAFDI